MLVEEAFLQLQEQFPDVEMKYGKTDNYLGNSGLVRVYPSSEQQISAILKYANENGKTVSVEGNGTKRGFGGLTETADILVSLSRYKGIVEHTVGDMTVTVKSGTVFRELQGFLAKYNQQVSLDPSWPEDATIGGVIASNDSGPKRLGYGSARDAVIGLRVVYPDGSIIRTGGKVVKNVAGYDTNKLFIGSMGTIGIITEITLKLRPSPKAESLSLLSFPDANLKEIHSFVVDLLDSMIEPISLELLNPKLSKNLTGTEQYTLVVGFEDVKSSVDYQINKLKDLKPQNSELNILQDEELRAFWDRLSCMIPNGKRVSSSNQTEACVKIGVKNLDVVQVIRESDLLQDSFNLKVSAHGGLGHGICQVNLLGAQEDVALAISRLREVVESYHGYLIAKHLSLALRHKIDVWGDKPTYFFLFEGIKKKIDPNRVLNEKRFVGGI